MGRFYVPPESIKENKIIVSGKEKRHIADVMRIGPGDEVEAFDGCGNIYKGRVEGATKKDIIIGILEKKKIARESKVFTALIVAIPKKNKMDDIVEKCTELGVDEIIPVITERTIVNLKLEKASRRAERWRKISKEAAKQCGRADLPAISDIASFRDVVKKISDFGLSFIPCLCGNRKKIGDILKYFSGEKILFFIGPEGDFTPGEIGLAVKNGAIPCNLGENVLKVDTAAVATLAIIKYELNGG